LHCRLPAVLAPTALPAITPLSLHHDALLILTYILKIPRSPTEHQNYFFDGMIMLMFEHKPVIDVNVLVNSQSGWSGIMAELEVVSGATAAVPLVFVGLLW
jgi:hypothetical protein